MASSEIINLEQQDYCSSVFLIQLGAKMALKKILKVFSMRWPNSTEIKKDTVRALELDLGD